MPELELWTIDQAAEHMGASTPVSARKSLSRWGVKAAGYKPVAGGGLRAVYRADEIRAAKAARPGRGKRTDLNPYRLMAYLDGYGHPARWIDGGPQVATKCGQTGIPDATDETLPQGETYPYCPKCDDANKKEARS